MKIILLLLLPFSSYARTLNLENHPFAIELIGSLHDINDIKHIPNSTNSTSKYSYNFNFGFLYTFNSSFNLKFGIEASYLPELKNIVLEDKTSASSFYYVYAPNTSFELNFYKAKQERAFFGTSFFYSYFKGTNNINSTYKDKITSNKFSYEPFIGFETALVDKYTLFFNLSYKFLNFNSFTVKSTGASLDYSELKLDFSGAAFKIGLRLYL